MADRVVPGERLNGEREATARIQEALRFLSDSLDLRGLGLKELPESVGELKHLRVLRVASNQLTSLPETIGNLKELQFLSLGRNAMSEVPEWLRQLKQLRELYLGRNQLTSAPEWIGELKQLESLNLDAAGLAAVPNWIGKLKKLRILSLGLNRLTTVPDFIGRLRLEVLHLENNRLKSLPPALNHHKSLRLVYLHGNPDLGIPPEILGPTYKSVMKDRKDPNRAADVPDYYFRTRSGKARPLNEAKLILLGRGEVGKTSLVDRIVRNVFKPQSKTDGIQITEWPIQLDNDEQVQLHIWDFGGQEIMHATHQFFLTDRSLYLIVLNGRVGGEDADVEYWLKVIESFGGDSPVIVVLNKIRSHPFDLNRRGLQEKYAGRIRNFIRTDCSDGTGIDELKQTIFRETDQLAHLRDRFPASWFSIKDRLATMKENYITFDRFRELCTEFGETDETDQGALATALHCLGVALNYKDDPRLRDTRVLNPRWVTNGIYKILNSKTIESNHGELQLMDLPNILDATVYPSKMHEFLIGLMRKIDLCFRFPEPRDHIFLIPQLLTKEQPELGDEEPSQPLLSFQYTYPFWPEGLLPRFIVRTHALSTSQKRWRTGVVLDFEGNSAMIKGDQQENKVLVSISGPPKGRRRLLAVIRSDFERIHADFPKLNPIASVPLPEYPSIAVPYQELTVLEASGVVSIPRVVANKVITIEVGKLLNSVELPSEYTGRPVGVFISYSHRDDELRAELETNLKLFERLGLIHMWHDRRIPPGDKWKDKIDQNLERADLILLLVSVDFLGSDYAYEVEMKRALARDAAKEARVVPIIVRDCPWNLAPFSHLQVLPRDGKPVRSWRLRDAAWRNVAEGIGKIIDEFQALARRS
jgi:internalin A